MSPPAADSTRDVEKKSVHRKVNKPLIEKRRRARINNCLAQLKTIVLEASETKSSRPSKLEKADILEMTVDFVKNKLNNNHATQKEDLASGNDLSDYVAGYTKCLVEISNFLEQSRPSYPGLQQNIVEHVSKKMKIHAPHEELRPTNAHVSDVCNSTEQYFTVTDSRVSEALDLSAKSPGTSALVTGNDLLERPVIENPVAKFNTHSSMPIGFLCDGKIVLLVQIPQSMTSEPRLVTSVPQTISQPLALVSNTLTSVPTFVSQVSGSNSTFQNSNLSASSTSLFSSDVLTNNASTQFLPIIPCHTMSSQQTEQMKHEYLDRTAKSLNVTPYFGLDNIAPDNRTEQDNVANTGNDHHASVFHWRPW